jgi:hypothetical protein
LALAHLYFLIVMVLQYGGLRDSLSKYVII